jgi:hypothetical protein
MMLQISSADLQQYKQRYMLQQQQKRLLQAQQQQQLVIPSSATTVVEQLTPGLQNIDSLLNNTVAPNVSLQVLYRKSYYKCFVLFLVLIDINSILGTYNLLKMTRVSVMSLLSEIKCSWQFQMEL